MHESKPVGLSEAAAQPMRVLVVDDEPLIRLVAADDFRDLGGFDVIEAANADEAWEYLQSGALVDAVFTDHRMPGSMTGAELAVRIRSHYPHIKIILTSAFYEGTEWDEPVVHKPYEIESTIAALKQWFQSRNRL